MSLAVHQAVNQAGASLRNAASKTTGQQGDESKQLGKSDFLNLMMTQMSNQDPLDPMKSEQMMQQMAALGTVEQLQNLNVKMDKMVSLQDEMSRSSAFAYLDKDVKIGTDSLQIREGITAPAAYSVSGNADKVFAHIISPEGEAIRKIDLGSQAKGSHSFIWDGKDSDGDVVSNGTYKYRIVASTEDGEKIDVNLFKAGRISGVDFEDGRPVATINGEKLPLSNIKGASNQSERRYDHAVPLPIKKTIQPRPLASNLKPLAVEKP